MVAKLREPRMKDLQCTDNGGDTIATQQQPVRPPREVQSWSQC